MRHPTLAFAHKLGNNSVSYHEVPSATTHLGSHRKRKTYETDCVPNAGIVQHLQRAMDFGFCAEDVVLNNSFCWMCFQGVLHLFANHMHPSISTLAILGTPKKSAKPLA